MQNSKLGFPVWIFAPHLMNTKGASSMKRHYNLEATQTTTWDLTHRFLKTWGDKVVSPFGGPVEADEAYLGGQRTNKSNAERKSLKGCGPVDMNAVAGVDDRATNKVVPKVVERASCSIEPSRRTTACRLVHVYAQMAGR